MEPIDEAFVIKTDGELIAQDVKLHARPFHVVTAWMREKKITGDLLDKRLWEGGAPAPGRDGAGTGEPVAQAARPCGSAHREGIEWR